MSTTKKERKKCIFNTFVLGFVNMIWSFLKKEKEKKD